MQDSALLSLIDAGDLLLLLARGRIVDPSVLVMIFKAYQTHFKTLNGLTKHV